MSSAPWRGEEDTTEQFPDANLKVTSQSDGTSTMHVPRSKSNTHNHDDDDGIEIDPELRYSFQRNYQPEFSIASDQLHSSPRDQDNSPWRVPVRKSDFLNCCYKPLPVRLELAIASRCTREASSPVSELFVI
ncbi:hypothetical protein MTR_4g031845 [Medicago truncatula]|uniref:Uncharacterized protein n=1 Tax=Medicago truncatula TaxID=3880 RepID=A0A072UTQ0_MEDTR|nr:hypothetical protein MTR_4g031845 [Medicago truncatula]